MSLAEPAAARRRRPGRPRRRGSLLRCCRSRAAPGLRPPPQPGAAARARRRPGAASASRVRLSSGAGRGEGPPFLTGSPATGCSSSSPGWPSACRSSCRWPSASPRRRRGGRGLAGHPALPADRARVARPAAAVKYVGAAGLRRRRRARRRRRRPADRAGALPARRRHAAVRRHRAARRGAAAGRRRGRLRRRCRWPGWSRSGCSSRPSPRCRSARWPPPSSWRWSAACSSDPAAGLIAPLLLTHRWLDFGDLLRGPVDWAGSAEGCSCRRAGCWSPARWPGPLHDGRRHRLTPARHDREGPAACRALVVAPSPARRAGSTVEQVRRAPAAPRRVRSASAPRHPRPTPAPRTRRRPAPTPGRFGKRVDDPVCPHAALGVDPALEQQGDRAGRGRQHLDGQHERRADRVSPTSARRATSRSGCSDRRSVGW